MSVAGNGLVRRGTGDVYTPTFITVAPDGTIGFDFTGHIKATGLDLNAESSGVFSELTAIRWLNSDGTLLAYLQGQNKPIPGPFKSLRMGLWNAGAGTEETGIDLGYAPALDILSVNAFAGAAAVTLIDEVGSVYTTVTYGTNWRRWNDLAASEVQVIKIGKQVRFKGRAERITAAFAYPSTFATLASIFRPTRTVIMAIPGTNGGGTNVFSRLVINTDGTCVIDGGIALGSDGSIGSSLYLDGIVFEAA